MSILNDFYLTDNIRLDPVGIDLVEPPRIALSPVLSAGRRAVPVPCITKMRGSLDVTLTLPMLGNLTLPFQGSFFGVDSRGRWLISWSVDPTRLPPTILGQRLERLTGQLIAAIAPLTPVRSDLMTCAGAACEFIVALSLVHSADLDEAFRRRFTDTQSVNELRVWIEHVTPTRAVLTSLQGLAGSAAPPPTPWPQPISLSLSPLCVNSARVTPTVFGRVHLDHPVLRSHLGFLCPVTAEGIDPPRELHVVRHPPVYNEPVIYFEVQLPADLTGSVRVTALTNDPSRARSTEFHIADDSFGDGCSGLAEVSVYDVVRVGCEAWDCGWTAMNDLSEFAGVSGGLPARYLTTRHAIESIGFFKGKRASLRGINNYGRVVGIIDAGNDKVDSFIYGEPDRSGNGAPELKLVPRVMFTALNDAGVAVGGQLDKNGVKPVRWVKGKLESIKMPSINALPLAINVAGKIAGIYLNYDKKTSAFSFDEEGFHDIGNLGGNVISVSMNDIGDLAGTVLIEEKTVRGFVHKASTGLILIEGPNGKNQCSVSGINNVGTVVGTCWDDQLGIQRAFCFDLIRGFVDLNKLVAPGGREVVAESALAVNNTGQILVRGRKNEELGSFLLNPASIPVPQLPIP